MAGRQGRCQTRRTSRKLHLVLNADSGETSPMVTDQDADDPSQVKPLLELPGKAEIAGGIKELIVPNAAFVHQRRALTLLQKAGTLIPLSN